MANKFVVANRVKGSPPTKVNVGSHAVKNTAKTDMFVGDIAATHTKKMEMELADLMNADLTAWKIQDLKGLLLKLKLKSSLIKAELVDRLRGFQESKQLLEKQLKEVNNT